LHPRFKFSPGNEPDPFKSLDFELGVHGTPFKGFWYDVGLFWMEFDNRTETRQFSPIDFIIVNTGSTRHPRSRRGTFIRFPRAFSAPAARHNAAGARKDVKDAKVAAVPGVPIEGFHPLQLIAFSNVQFLDAEFTGSDIPDQVGKTPAFAPDFLFKGGITFWKQGCFNVTLTGIYVAQQFWSDMDISLPTVPAKIPAYKVFNLSGEYYITRNVRLIAGISNLADEKYYSRVFFNGTIEPAPGRSGWAGISLTF
jgi:Fe(3+) dicitrate transport protein